MAVRIGKPAPEFEAEAWTRGAHGPKKVGLSQHRGKWVVLFFYRRDFTFICRTQRQRNAAGVTSAADRRTVSRRLETRSIDANNVRRMARKGVTAFAKTGAGRCDQKTADHEILCRPNGL